MRFTVSIVSMALHIESLYNVLHSHLLHQLFSLMDSKPPISRAKMISITKSAIKAMKVRAYELSFLPFISFLLALLLS